MQLGQLQAVLLTQQLTGNQWRARVVAQLAVAVEMIHHTNVRFQFGRQIVLLPDTGDPFQIFTGTLGVFALS